MERSEKVIKGGTNERCSVTNNAKEKEINCQQFIDNCGKYLKRKKMLTERLQNVALQNCESDADSTVAALGKHVRPWAELRVPGPGCAKSVTVCKHSSF